LVQALVSLADAQIAQEKYDEARQSLDLALSTSPDNSAAEGSLGLLEYKQGGWEMASSHLAKAWEHSHANAQVGFELARSLRRSGNLKPALDLLLSLKSQLNNTPSYHLELAQLYGQLHQPAESAVELNAFDSLQRANGASLRFDKPHTYVF
jgi:predicted Zn-dependent protease